MVQKYKKTALKTIAVSKCTGVSPDPDNTLLSQRDICFIPGTALRMKAIYCWV